MRHDEAATANLKNAIDRLGAIPKGTIDAAQFMADVALAQALATCANAEAILAVNETLKAIHATLTNPPAPPAPAITTCPSEYSEHSRYVCMLPLGHAGKHESKERAQW